MTREEVQAKREAIERRIDDARCELTDLQMECPHPEEAIHSRECQDCDKFFTTAEYQALLRSRK